VGIICSHQGTAGNASVENKTAPREYSLTVYPLFRLNQITHARLDNGPLDSGKSSMSSFLKTR
jgi:hypothetical protein